MLAKVLTEKPELASTSAKGLSDCADLGCSMLLASNHGHFFEPMKPSRGRALREAGESEVAAATKTRTGGVPT